VHENWSFRNYFVSSLLVVSAVFVTVLALVSNSCTTNPVTNKSEFMLLSLDDKTAMGKKTEPEIIASYGQYEDADLTEYLNAIGKRLGAASHQPNIPYTFRSWTVRWSTRSPCPAGTSS
jgi:predicted Zn-dependent protease